MEVQPPRVNVTQWTSIITVSVVVLGLVWTVITYIDKLTVKLDSVGERLDQIDISLRDIDVRGRSDHDRLTELQAEFRARLRERSGDH